MNIILRPTHDHPGLYRALGSDPHVPVLQAPSQSVIAGPDGKNYRVLWDGDPEPGDVLLCEDERERTAVNADAIGRRVLVKHPEIKQLLKDRDSCTDHYGEDLVSTVMGLADGRYGDHPCIGMHPGNKEALVAFRALTYGDQLGVVRHVLGEYGEDDL